MTTTYKTYKWFNPRPSTITEGTAMYRDLASKHHPDPGGSVSDMQEINAEWDELKPTLPRFCSEQAKQGRQQYDHHKDEPYTAVFLLLLHIKPRFRELLLGKPCTL